MNTGFLLAALHEGSSTCEVALLCSFPCLFLSARGRYNTYDYLSICLTGSVLFCTYYIPVEMHG